MNNYKVETPYGTYTRKSKREYSHIVVFHGKILYLTGPNKEKIENSDKDKIHTMAEFCGRYDLALKAIKKYDNSQYDGVCEMFEVAKV